MPPTILLSRFFIVGLLVSKLTENHYGYLDSVFIHPLRSAALQQTRKRGKTSGDYLTYRTNILLIFALKIQKINWFIIASVL